MATTTKPDRLYYTGNDEADRLIAREPLALLIGFALDQQVPVPTAFTGPLKIKQRLGSLETRGLPALEPQRREAPLPEKPAAPRLPWSRAARVARDPPRARWRRMRPPA